MRFYVVADEYIQFLQQFDAKVSNNAGSGYKARKPYVGVVLEAGSHRFLAPLTSYKPAHDRIQSSSCSAFKLHERTNPANKLGMIALNYMIPVIDSQIALLDMDAQEARYKAMLYKQYEFIKSHRAEITARAAKLYDHVVSKRTEFYVRISCNIPVLIDAYRAFAPATGSGEGRSD
jgi:protein AbiQ